MKPLPEDVQAQLDELKPVIDGLLALVNGAPLSPFAKMRLSMVVTSMVLGNSCGHLIAVDDSLKGAPMSEVLTSLMVIVVEMAEQREALEAATPTGPAS